MHNGRANKRGHGAAHPHKAAKKAAKPHNKKVLTNTTPMRNYTDSVRGYVNADFDSPGSIHQEESNAYHKPFEREYRERPSAEETIQGLMSPHFLPQKPKKKFRSRFDRGDPLTNLLGTFAYSYLARTAADKDENDNEINDDLQADLQAKAQLKLARKNKLHQDHLDAARRGKKLPLSAALDLADQPANENMSQLRSNIVSAEAVTKTIHQVFKQHHIQSHSMTPDGLNDLLSQPNSPFKRQKKKKNAATGGEGAAEGAAAEGEGGGEDEAAANALLQAHAFDILQDALSWTKQRERYLHNKKMGVAQAEDEGHDGILSKKKIKSVVTDDIGGIDDSDLDNDTTAQATPPAYDIVSTQANQATKRQRRQRLLDEIKKDLPDLQKSIFTELDGIVKFANLHYQTTLQALSKHSLSSLYPPELLAVEFFDYRRELFLDCVYEDLGALYKAKKFFYLKALAKQLAIGEISQEEHDEKHARLHRLTSSLTAPNDFGPVKAFFQANPIALVNSAGEPLTLADVYADQELGFTSHDTTFLRDMTNPLEKELVIADSLCSALTDEIFSIKKFEAGLNLAAHRYPGVNVPVEKYIEQLSLEHQSITKAVDEYTELTEGLTKMGRASQLSPLQDHVLRWFKPLAQSIDDEINMVKANQVRGLKRSPMGTDDVLAQQATHADVKLVIPYIQHLKSTELGCIALHETLSRILNAPNGLRVIDLALAIGKVVNTEANLHVLRKDRNNWQRLRRYYPGAKLNEQVIRRAVNNQKGPDGQPLQGDDDTVWSDLVQAKIGSFLIKHMLSSASIRQQVDQETGELRPVEKQFVPHRNPHKDNEQLVTELEVPSFIYEHRQVGNNHVGYLTCHNDVRHVLEKAHTDVQTLSIRLLPMVIPPRPWRGTRDGGYLSVPSTVIRSKGSRKQVTAVEGSNIDAVFGSLNYLGRVAWGINNHVLSVIDNAWSEGGGFAAMPSRRDIPAPPQPVLNLLQYDEKAGRYFTPHQNQQQQQGGVDPEQLAQQTTQWRQWQRDTQRISQYNADLHSLRCDLQLRLNQARQLSDQPVYFPLNMDFRGRTYPIPPHLNHLGSDLARALLTFHHKKPLGPKGMYWLKAHLAAQFGVDKVSFDDRVKYVEENAALVVDTAKRPFYANVPNPHYGKLRGLDEPLYPIPREVQHKYARVYIRQQVDLEQTEPAKQKRLKQLLRDYGSQGLHLDMSIEDDPNECIYPLDGERDVRAKLPWWQLADSPWQALATCAEIVAAQESPNPELYETGLPVHQDGSCNGLQHYAALGRDLQGGSRVNLTNSDKPQDVYSHVLHEVKRRMEADMEQTNNPLAKMLLPYMNRKVVKQTVMTSVYGVTFIGARDQILKQLRDLKDVPWEQASDLIVAQQVESRKKFLQKTQDGELRKKQRERAKILKSLTEAERIDFLNREMMDGGLQDESIHELLDEYDTLQDEQHPEGVLIEGQAQDLQQKQKQQQQQQASQQITVSQQEAEDQQRLVSQRQIQEAAMRASAIYLARLTLTSLGTVFSAATRIMSWLTECAGIISRYEQPVSWITPLQLPVVQHYRLISKFQVKTLNQTVTLHHDNDTLPVSPTRQRAAFPPNFVHSLDATHMMLTSQQCAKHGLVFSSVHDSYWTHPGDVDKMNALLRDQFIQLYSQPILEDLRESFVLRYPTAEFPALPERGDLNLEEVRKSNYFFN